MTPANLIFCATCLALAACSSGSTAPDPAEPPAFTWSVASACPLARFEANGVAVGGELWVMGGFIGPDLQVTKQIDIYDPAGDGWRRGPDLPAAETHLAVVALGSDVIVAGGFVGALSFTTTRPPMTNTVFRWNLTKSEWAAGPTLPNPGAAFAWALVGTQLHLAGGLVAEGNTDSSDHSVWDTATEATWTPAAALPNPRNHGAGAAAAGTFYAIGGRHEWDESGGNVADVDGFDLASGMWTPRAPMPAGRSEIGASTSTLGDGRILVVGGSLNGIVPSDDVLLYDPGKNAWSELPKLPEKRKGAVAVQLGRRIVVSTGSPTSVDPSATTFVGCCL